MTLMNSKDGDSPDVVAMDNVSFSYGKGLVLKDVSLTLRKGDFVGVIGPNGGGKTTLLRLMLGVIKPTQGSVWLLGENPTRSRIRAGYVPQETSSNKLFPISVFEVVLMGTMAGRGLFHAYTREDRDRAVASLEELNIASLKDKTIGDLSGGQRQKVLLARALVAAPSILFLDEPTSSVDSCGQDDLYERLRTLNARGTTVLLVTHNVGAVSSYI